MSGQSGTTSGAGQPSSVTEQSRSGQGSNAGTPGGPVDPGMPPAKGSSIAPSKKQGSPTTGQPTGMGSSSTPASGTPGTAPGSGGY
jgi:hypothetical protein